MSSGKLVNVSGSNIEELNLTSEDLEDLVEVDISRNRFQALPPSLQYCVNIKILKCSSNRISISDGETHDGEFDFFKPQKENKFELLHPEDSIYSEDELKGTSSELGSCSRKQSSPPPPDRSFDFSKLTNLTWIDLSHNRIVWLPPSFISLNNLESLNLSHNLLTHLPHFFNSDEKLRKLDLSMNSIIEAPDWLLNIRRCVRICLSGNPFLELNFPESFGNTCRRVRYLEMENSHIRNFPTALTSLLGRRSICENNDTCPDIILSLVSLPI